MGNKYITIYNLKTNLKDIGNSFLYTMNNRAEYKICFSGLFFPLNCKPAQTILPTVIQRCVSNVHTVLQ